jgi:hypothetical protein
MAGWALTATLVANAGVSAVGGAHAVAGDRYIGVTSQGQATTILVSVNGRSVKAILSAVAYDGLCGKRPGGLPYQILWEGGAAIRRGGQFSVLTEGRTIRRGAAPVIVRGTFSGGDVSGTITESGRAAHCPAPRQVDNPYRARFRAHGTPGSAP